MPSAEGIQLKLPMSLPADQRDAIIRQHSQLLSILNGPDTDARGKSLAAAKKAARSGMRQLREQIAKLGGRVDINLPSQQTDPTTGEITGGSVKESVGPTSHSVSFTQSKTTPNKMLQDFSSLMPAQGPAPASTGAPAVTPFTPLRATPTPFAPPDQVGAAPKPTVPPETEDLNADPVLGALPPDETQAPLEQPSTAAESPEMAMLHKMLNEQTPTPPSGELTLGQKIAYSFLAGMIGIDKIMPLVHEQKAEAVQKFLMQRQERENLMHNLMQFVEVQQREADRVQQRQIALDERTQTLQSRLVAIHSLQQQGLAAHTAAQTAIEALQVEPDPTLRSRADDLIAQGNAFGQQAQLIDSLVKTNPAALAGSDSPITSFTQALANYRGSVDKALAELETRAKANALPDTVKKDIDSIKAMIPALDSAIRQVEGGVTGPGGITAAAMNAPFGLGDLIQWTFSNRAEALGRLEGTLGTVEQLIRTIGPGANISQVEKEVFAGVLLHTTGNPGNLLGKLRALRSWHQMKLNILQGKGSQLDADKILLRMEDNIDDDPDNPGKNDPIVGNDKDGNPIWRSKSGLSYVLKQGDY